MHAPSFSRFLSPSVVYQLHDCFACPLPRNTHLDAYFYPFGNSDISMVENMLHTLIDILKPYEFGIGMLQYAYERRR
jgi:hypothetical protein